ncbi:hypothetical protein [uncultured Lactobacillus sp.]|uniref:hypothetical protein n=1 Tax=uncultured Lactobacillus sp. TaxID=153152 RepID=UPI00258FDE76|nr:hypothetical protein [uncultured Lactobacillus sp.]
MSIEKDKQDRFFERFQTSLREYLLTFNNGVITIIITIMVLSIPADTIVYSRDD